MASLKIWDGTQWTEISGDGGSGIDNVVEDLSPELGGNLDVNGKDIVSSSNGDIDIIPNGTGTVNIGNATGDAVFTDATGYALRPSADGTSDLGTATYRWSVLHVDTITPATMDTFTVTNGTDTPSYDAAATTVDELADVVYTLLVQLDAIGLITLA